MGAALYSASATLTFDENGGNSLGLQSRVSSDSNADGTGPAGGGTTLAYLYPVDGNNDHLQLGWLVINDPNGSISDLIRFDSTTGGPTGPYYQQIFFYSNDHDGDLADNWPATSVVNQIIAQETPGSGYNTTMVVTEDVNGNAYYTPTSSTQPGYHFIGTSPGTAYSYEFMSSVPEPGTMIAGALLLLPFGASTLRMLRRRTA